MGTGTSPFFLYLTLNYVFVTYVKPLHLKCFVTVSRARQGEGRNGQRGKLSSALLSGGGELKPDRAVLTAPGGGQGEGAGGEELAGVTLLPQEGPATFLMAPLMCKEKKKTY